MGLKGKNFKLRVTEGHLKLLTVMLIAIIDATGHRLPGMSGAATPTGIMAMGGFGGPMNEQVQDQMRGRFSKDGGIFRGILDFGEFILVARTF